MKPALALGVLAACAWAIFALAGGNDEERDGPRNAAGKATSAEGPNLLVVMTDDQSVSMFDGVVMPFTHRMLSEEGAIFSQAIAAPPLCCPARAGFLTGRYPQNHGVLENIVGYPTMRGKSRTFPVALRRAGYRTGMVGKFMNGYEPFAGPKPAPGFDRWFAMFGYADYFDFQVSDDGELHTESGYATDVLTAEAIRFTGSASRSDEPFFLWLSYNAPHTVGEGYPPPCNGADAQPPDAETFARFADEKLPRPPSFDEDDVSDKPSLAPKPPLTRKRTAETTRAYRCARAASAGVDDGMKRLVRALERQDQLEDTVLVFLSDNGIYNGEHRVVDDKRLPLDPALRIPMGIRVGEEVEGPRAAPGRVSELVSQVDLAPTLLDYAGVDPCAGGARCASMDGRSLRPLLSGEGDWPADRAIPFALAEAWTYGALRTRGELYMELTETRFEAFPEPRPELYDLEADPHQLDAVTNRSDPRIVAASERLSELSNCSGIEGRDKRRGTRPFCE